MPGRGGASATPLMTLIARCPDAEGDGDKRYSASRGTGAAVEPWRSASSILDHHAGRSSRTRSLCSIPPTFIKGTGFIGRGARRMHSATVVDVGRSSSSSCVRRLRDRRRSERMFESAKTATCQVASSAKLIATAMRLMAGSTSSWRRPAM